MKKPILATLIAVMAIATGLYAQETQPQIKLDLVWEEEFPDTIFDVGFDTERANLLPAWVIEGSFYDAKKIDYINETGQITFTKKLKQYSVARISQNGKYVGVLEPERLTEKEYEPVGPVVIYGKNGKIAHKTRPITGHYFWVSPYGDEVINKTIWVDNWFYSTITNEGVYLDQTDKSIYSLGNNLKIMSWHNSKKNEDLVAVYDPSLKDNYKIFTVPGTFYGDNYHSYFLLVLPKSNLFALSTRSELIRLYNIKGEFMKSINYDVSGQPLYSSPNNNYMLVITGKKSDVGVRIEGGTVLDIAGNKEILKFEKTVKNKSKYISRSDEIGSYGLIALTNDGMAVSTNIDSLWFIYRDQTISMGTGINRINAGEKIVTFKVNANGDKLCIVTNLRILVFNIGKVGVEK